MKQLIIILLCCLLLSCHKDEEFNGVVKACFEFKYHEKNIGEVHFTNCSENATHFLWIFEDGITSDEAEPTYKFKGNLPYNVTLIAYNGNRADATYRYINPQIIAYKPNIYIYPTIELNLCVAAIFPMGGNILVSEPEYSDRWCIKVDTTGKIDDQYNYLFYESTQPNIFQYDLGWCIRKENLQSFFETNMKLYNFSDAEIKDFTDYWIPLLKEDSFYCIYPQTNHIIDQVIQLDFSIQPDNVFRLFYGIKGVDEFINLQEPKIETFNRDGFYVVEWGVIRK